MKRCPYCKKPLSPGKKYCSKECAKKDYASRTEKYRKRINNIRKNMHIDCSNGAQEKRRCYNCGKEFISNTAEITRKGIIVRGEFTCCWQCTQALIERDEL